MRQTKAQLELKIKNLERSKGVWMKSYKDECNRTERLRVDHNSTNIKHYAEAERLHDKIENLEKDKDALQRVLRMV